MSTSTKKNQSSAAPRRPLPRNLRELMALLDENPAPPEVVEEARKIKDLAMMVLGTGHSMVTSVLYGKCYHQIPSTAIDTMAVMLMADGTTALVYNPYFTVALEKEGAMFVLFHESRHVIYRHLFNESHLRNDPVFTHAVEMCINHEALIRLNRKSMPTVPVLDEKGQPVLDENQQPVRQPTGIDPAVEYAKYEKDLKKQGLVPVDYKAFIRTDFACYNELKRMSKPAGQDQSMQVCVHGSDGDGDGDDGSGTVPMDDATAEQVAKEVLQHVMRQAMAGKETAREEMLALGERTEGSSERTSKLWGDLGLGRLRGETLATRRVDWWQQWVSDALASLLCPGEKLIYNKKRGALDMMLGNDTILQHRGMEEERLALVAIDTSGSMPDHVLEYLAKLVGHTDGVDFRWVAFDGSVEPFVAGEAVTGGGGTNFANVMDYAEGRLAVNGKTLDIHPDVILMLTDGYAPPIQPAEPDKWVWLITEHGSDDWITAQGDMRSHKITTGEGA